MPESQSVLITGASSGLGAALATELAAPGVTLHLSGRDPDRLRGTTAACEARSAVVHPKVLDVQNESSMEAWVTGARRLDLVIANAGVSAGTGHHEPESPGQTRTIFATNLTGVLNTVLPAMQVMQTQLPGTNGLKGRIAVIASIAAFVPAPGAPAYCASKSAADAWVVGTRPAARMRGIVMTSVCPGYVRTAMTARNQFPMPGLMDADRAARIILRGIRRGRARIVFPWWMGLGARIGGLLPADLLGRLLATQTGKAPDPTL